LNTDAFKLLVTSKNKIFYCNLRLESTSKSVNAFIRQSRICPQNGNELIQKCRKNTNVYLRNVIT